MSGLDVETDVDVHAVGRHLGLDNMRLIVEVDQALLVCVFARVLSSSRCLPVYPHAHLMLPTEAWEGVARTIVQIRRNGVHVSPTAQFGRQSEGWASELFVTLCLGA
jgi:hypothetical protein